MSPVYNKNKKSVVKNLEKILNILPNDKILLIDENLAEINLHLDNDAKDTPGILAIITNELALNGISVVEVLSCFPELLWFVYQNDLLKAYLQGDVYEKAFELLHEQMRMQKKMDKKLREYKDANVRLLLR